MENKKRLVNIGKGMVELICMKDGYPCACLRKSKPGVDCPYLQYGRPYASTAKKKESSIKMTDRDKAKAIEARERKIQEYHREIKKKEREIKTIKEFL